MRQGCGSAAEAHAQGEAQGDNRQDHSTCCNHVEVAAEAALRTNHGALPRVTYLAILALAEEQRWRGRVESLVQC